MSTQQQQNDEFAGQANPEPQDFTQESGEFLPEAGGVAWADVYIPSQAHQTYFKVSLTARAANPKDALDQLVDAIAYGAKVYGLQVVPRSPRTQASQPRTESAESPAEPQ